MGAAREKDQADFDLEQFIDLFDEALTSNDPRVKQALATITKESVEEPTPIVEEPAAEVPVEESTDEHNTSILGDSPTV